MHWHWLIVPLIAGKWFKSASSEESADDSSCEDVEVPMCATLGYNHTNVRLSPLKFTSQKQAAMDIYTYYPLIQMNCAVELKPFLCSFYSPICMQNFPVFVPPCRFLCEAARHGCFPYMKTLGFDWPDELACEAMPERGENELCLDFNLPRRVLPTAPATSLTTFKAPSGPFSLPTGANNAGDGECCNRCQYPSFVEVVMPEAKIGPVANCAQTCVSPFFRPPTASRSMGDREFVEKWIWAWVLACGIVSVLTVSTFMVQPIKVDYPERPILFLSVCYLLLAVGYRKGSTLFGIRLIVGHESLSCDHTREGVAHAVPPGQGSLPCLFSFIFVYFFGMAASLWWVCLCFTWFLAAALKWSKEAITKKAPNLHLVSWGLPAFKTVLALSMGHVEGDNISGMCNLGTTNVTALRMFVLIPSIIYLISGAVLLSIGFVSLFRIRSSIRKSGGPDIPSIDIDKLEKLIIKIAIFSVLYTFPAALLIGSQFYESWWREEALATQLCACDQQEVKFTETEVQVILLRYSMHLIPGIGAGIWICTPKTFNVWRTFFDCRHRRKVALRSTGISSVPLTAAASHHPTMNIVRASDGNLASQVGSESHMFLAKPV